MGRIKLLKASAGSGKTYQLVYQFVRSVIKEPTLYRHILAVTFTNKATEEMKRRILAEINELALGKQTHYLQQLQKDLNLSPQLIGERARIVRTKILHDYSRFAVLTIDKFFQRIIRSFIKELGIDLNFNLELRIDPLLSSATDDLIDDIAINTELRQWIMELVEERIESGKRWNIKEGLTALGKHLFSEKYKRLQKQMPAKDELKEIVDKASTKYFTIKKSLIDSASKAIKIIDDNGLSVNDFPHKGTGFANYFYKIASGDIKEYGSRVEQALESNEKWYAKNALVRDQIIAITPQLRPLLEQICDTVRNNMKFLESVELLRENYRNFALLSDLSAKIDNICASENIMPISETNSIFHKLISGNDTPFVFEKVGNHFSHYVMDEFQDTSQMQWENFMPLLHNALSQSPETDNPALIVGDVKQSIYRWRGGDWHILSQGIKREFGAIDTLELTTNYRSFGNIVDFNNHLIDSCIIADNDGLNAQIDSALNTNFISNKTHGELYDMLSSAYANHRQKSVKEPNGGYISVRYYGENEDNEYIPPVINQIEQLQDRGYRLSDIAILVRTNKDGITLANILLEHKSQNPESKYRYDVVTQEALMINSAEVVSFVVACLKLGLNGDNAICRATFNKFLGKELNVPLSNESVAFFSSIKLKTSEEAFEAIVLKFELNKSEQNISYLQAFHEQLMLYSNSTISDIALFVKWWDENGSDKSVQVPQNQDAITIITVHKAKGLEFRVVLIPYCSWGLAPRLRSVVWANNSDVSEFKNLGYIPIGYKAKMGRTVFADSYYNELVLTHIDNINTFYVAITRAVEELHIMIPEKHFNTVDRVSGLVNKALEGGDTATFGPLKGRITEGESGKIFEFGEPLMHSKETKSINCDNIENEMKSSFDSYEIENRLKLRLNTKRYLEDGLEYSVSPRNYGVLMHRIFENAENSADIELTLKRMEQNGDLSKQDLILLREKLSEAFKNPLISSWFDGDWQVVRTESEIIMPKGGRSRPDRVLIKDNRAVVVDYKFGLHRRPKDGRQVSQYIDTLNKMGYEFVEGYVWYVSLGDVELVPQLSAHTQPFETTPDTGRI